jgi:hypothetical protein
MRFRLSLYTQWEQEWKSSTKGGHLRKIDNTLPATYTRRLYRSPEARASISESLVLHGNQSLAPFAPVSLIRTIREMSIP